MSLVALFQFPRDDSWNFALFVHILGAVLPVGWTAGEMRIGSANSGSSNMEVCSNTCRRVPSHVMAACA